MKPVTLSLAIGLVLSLVLLGNAEAGDVEMLNSRIDKLEALINNKFANAILITDKDCKSFGEGWQQYERLSGRFALAAGEGRDDRKEEMNFGVGEKGGEYNHVLSIPEMPEHSHAYVDLYSQTIRADYGDDEPSEVKKGKEQHTEKKGRR